MGGQEPDRYDRTGGGQGEGLSAVCDEMTCFGNWHPLVHLEQCPPVMSGCFLFAFQTSVLIFFHFRKKRRAGSGRRHDRGLHGAQRLHGDGGRGGEDAGLAYIREVRRVLRRTNFFGLRHTLGIL